MLAGGVFFRGGFPRPPYQMKPPRPLSKETTMTLSISESAVAQHEIFVSYIKAGFSREEALELLKVIIAASQGQAK